jgi:hypothetical protein
MQALVPHSTSARQPRQVCVAWSHTGASAGQLASVVQAGAASGAASAGGPSAAWQFGGRDV